MPALYSCTVRECRTECGLQCGAAEYTLPPPDAAAACQSCLVDNDCKLAIACTSTVACLSWAQCYNSCSTPDCQQTCTAANDAGQALAEGIDPKRRCWPACAVGSNWACVGNVVWPPPTTNATTLTASVSDFVSGMPVAGIDAYVCPFQSCETQLGHGGTDVNGNLTIQVPAVSPHVVGLAPDSYAVLTSPTLANTLLFWEYPVSEPVATIGAPEAYVASANEWQEAFLTQGVTWDSSTRGILGVLVRDCRLMFAGDVSLSISGPDMTDSTIRRFYLHGRNLDFAATSTDPMTGVGGFVNVPEGEVRVTATAAMAGAPDGGLTYSSAEVYIQKGAITEVFLSPMPTSALQ